MTELSPEARALIHQVAELDQPSPTDRERVRAQLAFELGASVFSPQSATLPSRMRSEAGMSNASLPGMWAKASWCAGVLCVVGSVLWLWPSPAPSPRAHSAASAKPAVQRVNTQLAPQNAATPKPPSAAERSLRDAVLEPSAPILSPHMLPQSTRRKKPLAHTAAPPQSALQDDVANEPHALAPAHAESAHESVDATSVKPQGKASLALELRWLRDAEFALRTGQFREALRLAREHASRFPEGRLREERFGIIALARCALGDPDQSDAQRFLVQSAGSPLAPRVRKTCKIEP